MPQYSLNQISDVVKGHLSGYNNQIVKHLLIDSRGVAYPSESIFFAIKGVRHVVRGIAEGFRREAGLLQ